LNANPQGLIVLDIGLQKMELGLSYHEMVLSIPVEFNGKTGTFSALLYLNKVFAITAGREIFGDSLNTMLILSSKKMLIILLLKYQG